MEPGAKSRRRSRGPGRASASDLHVKVRFHQSGGITGLIAGCDLDTARLSAKEAARLRSLITRSRLAAAPHPGPRGVRGTEQARDLCCYEITVETEDGIHRISFDEMSLPERISPLVAYLRSHAKPRPLA